jgi:subtilisin family serine protease
VIASGNNGFSDSMSSPGCISSAVSVGSTTKSDTLSSFSNSASFLHLLAPGSNINSSVPGGGFEVMNGTSMATPHVAGAWALLKQKTPSASVSSLLSSLQSTGTPVTDTRVTGGVTKPRINIADAAGIQGPANDAFANAQYISGATVNGTNVRATRESGEPDHLPAASGSLGENTVWYNWTAPSSGQVTMDTCMSSFDTTLAVYTGSVLSTLSQVGSDDDSCDTPNGAGSRLSFNATAGTTYRIALGGTYLPMSGRSLSI